jgi:Putative ATP-dependent DNA helicase recG C-terminal
MPWGREMERVVYLASHPDEPEVAEKLMPALTAAQFMPHHYRTTKVGDSPLEAATRFLEQGVPVIICATYRSASSKWVKQLANAANSRQNRVFVVQMDEDLDVEHLSLKRVVADYWRDPDAAMRQLCSSLAAILPPISTSRIVDAKSNGEVTHDFLDELTEVTEFDAGAVKKFRRRLRPSANARLPRKLPAWDFLQQSNLMRNGRLTRAGVLLFGREPSVVIPTARVQCAEYFGPGKVERREIVDIAGNVPRQIAEAFRFVTDRTREGDVPTDDDVAARSVHRYPMIAVREVIANALVHRDYDASNICVHVRLYSDRLEVTSPGNWEGRGVTEGQEQGMETLVGESRRRNFRLANVLTWSPIFEGEGSGLPSALEDCDRLGSLPPVVIQRDGLVTVTLFPRNRDVDPRRRRSDLRLRAAQQLARRLRDLRESMWPDVVLTQAGLAQAFSTEGRVSAATVSSWESTSFPKTPAANRLGQYARFFSTRRSLEGGSPHVIAEELLTESEREKFLELQEDLLMFLRKSQTTDQNLFKFEHGPVVVIGGEYPRDSWGRHASEDDPNYSHLRRYADGDALMDLYGYLRASNPSLDVFTRLASESTVDDLACNIVLLGAIGWNRVTRRFQKALEHVPITQMEVSDLAAGEIFRVETAEGVHHFYPEYLQIDERKELISDVGYLARLRNPFKVDRTLTIFAGIHARGVLGAVRCLTDSRVREENEEYLADRFPDGDFALLVRVPIVSGQVISPMLQDPSIRLYEWSVAEWSPEPTVESQIPQSGA